MWNSLIPTHFLIFTCIFAFVFAEEEQPSKKVESDGIAKLNRPDVAICEGTLSAFFVSDNVNIRGTTNASAIIGGVNEKQCIDFCAKNQDHKGRTVLCASVVYQNELKECRMYRRASFPDGELLRKSEDGHRYFEKFCLPEDAPAHCANRQFVRVDEYILKGYAQSTTTVPTMAECAAYCMHEREYECKSAMYFYEEGECITNVESAITAPDDFQRPDDEDKVIFFHNGCILPGAGTAGPPGEFELAQSQDATSTIGGQSSSISPLQQSEDTSGIASSTAEGETITVQLPTVSSSPSSLSPSFSPSGINQQQQEEKESPQPSDPTTVSSSSPVVIISSSSTMPDMADGIPSSSDLPAEEKQGQNDENDNSSGKSSKTNNDEPQRESSAEGQKLEESKKETINDEPNEGERLKAVPIPLSNLPEESSSTHRLHPKHLALPPLADEGNAGEGEGGIGGEKEANENNEQQQRQYGAKTIERASDGSFQEKAAGIGPIPTPKAAGLATNRKGPESTKRLHLKLIKDRQQQPRPNITNINIGHSSFPSSPSESPLPLATSTEQQQNENGGENKENITPVSSTSKSVEEGQNGSQQQQIIVPDESPEEQFQGAEGFFSRWGAWTPCHVPGERRVRRRKCLDLRRCKGALMQVDYCPRDIPPESAEDTMTLEGQPQQQLAHQQAADQATDQQKLSPIPATVVHSDGSHPVEVGGNTIPEGPPSNNNKNDGGTAPVPIVNLQVGQMVGGGLDGGAQPPAIMPPSQNGEGKNVLDQQIVEGKQQQPIPIGAPAPRPSEEEAAAIWSPWNGTCQHFASSQPCKDGQVIGFESRECIAKDPLACKGPFFRYCTLPC